jgi:uncharacterized protein (TIGR02145 family)
MRHLTLILIALAATFALTAQDCTAPTADGITYGVTEINGQCWITQNLGAPKQAGIITSKNPSVAGLIYQFNQIDPSVWQTRIMEDCNWIAEHDPCQALGPGWRLPTRLEWKAYDEQYRLSMGKQAYKSPLKLHYSGWYYTDLGEIFNRGSSGAWWSSTQALPEVGFIYYTNAGAAAIYTMPKHYGLPVRCLRD